MNRRLFDLLDVTEDIIEMLTEQADAAAVSFHVLMENAYMPGITDCIGDEGEVRRELKRIMEKAIYEAKEYQSHHIYIKVCGRSIDDNHGMVIIENPATGIVRSIQTLSGIIVSVQDADLGIAL